PLAQRALSAHNLPNLFTNRRGDASARRTFTLRERERMFFQQLFAKKSLEQLAAEAAGENRLRRILGPIGLTSLGVGAIIGAGIFVMTGRAAAQDAGPAIILSYCVAGLGCLFAALCYAEFASA